MHKRRHHKYHHCHLMEWWSSILLILIGFDAFFHFMADHILHISFINGFKAVFPVHAWEGSFVLIGIIQFISLTYRSFGGRAVASFFASSLFIWGVLNMMVYGRQWHVSLMVWGLFALVNLYTLAKILAGIKQVYEYNLRIL